MELNEMTVEQLRVLAEQTGVELPAKGKKAELIAVLEEALDSQQEPEGENDTGEAQEAQEERPIYQAYVGPAIPGGLLTPGKILYGTKKDTEAYLEPVLKRYPTAKQLIVPMRELEKGMRDVKNPKKLLYHTAQKLISELKNGG